MSILKLIIKWLFKFVLGFICFVIIYLASAWCLSRITINKENITSQDVTIYIKTNGVHTDIVVPVKNQQINWSKEVKFTNITSQDTTYTYLGMGWGDKGFYLETPTWADLKTSTAFKAAFALSTTAIHATYYHQLHENDSCRKITISKEQYQRLINYIKESFQTDASGHFMVIKTGANYGDSDAFYEARGKYNLFKTCNTWANNSLKACGQKCCAWTIFDTGIFLKYNKQ